MRSWSCILKRIAGCVFSFIAELPTEKILPCPKEHETLHAGCAHYRHCRKPGRKVACLTHSVRHEQSLFEMVKNFTNYHVSVS